MTPAYGYLRVFGKTIVRSCNRFADWYVAREDKAWSLLIFPVVAVWVLICEFLGFCFDLMDAD